MTIYVVRHACAGHKAEWTGPDAQRPLDPAGERQAAVLVAVLAGAPLAQVVSSPSRRCVDTVAAVASAHEVPLVREPALRSPASGVPAIASLLHDEGGPGAGTLVCTHGEVLEPLLGRLRSEGLVVAGDPGDAALLAKGGLWELRRQGPRWHLELVGDASLDACPHHHHDSLRAAPRVPARR